MDKRPEVDAGGPTQGGPGAVASRPAAAHPHPEEADAEAHQSRPHALCEHGNPPVGAVEGGIGAGPGSGRRQPRGRVLGGRGVRLGYHLDPLVRVIGELLLCCRSGTSGLQGAPGGRRAGGVGRSAGPLPALPRRRPPKDGGVTGRGRVGRPRRLGGRRTDGSGVRGRATVRSGGVSGREGETVAVAWREGPAGAGRTGWWAARRGASRRRPPARRRRRSARRGARPRPRAHRPRASRGPRSPRLEVRSRVLDARYCIRMPPCVQSRRPHSAAVRVGALQSGTAWSEDTNH